MDGTPTSDPDVVNNVDGNRWEIWSDGRRAGFLRYRTLPDRVAMIHTEIDPAFEGRGFGGRLVKAALDDVRGHGGQVSPICPFVVEYIRRHPDYLDLVDDRRKSTVTGNPSN
jgi:uncharacterized protein